MIATGAAFEFGRPDAWPMSDVRSGANATNFACPRESALPSTPDLGETSEHVSFVPNPEIVDRLTDCTAKRQLHHAVAV
jgi:hypothetical protein